MKIFFEQGTEIGFGLFGSDRVGLGFWKIVGFQSGRTRT